MEMYVCLCVNICICACGCLGRSKGGPGNPWGLSFRLMCATWVLETELRLSGRVTTFLDHRAISLECCYVAQEPFPDY